jgi:hypothetical protein
VVVAAVVANNNNKAVYSIDLKIRSQQGEKSKVGVQPERHNTLDGWAAVRPFLCLIYGPFSIPTKWFGGKSLPNTTIYS